MIRSAIIAALIGIGVFLFRSAREPSSERPADTPAHNEATGADKQASLTPPFDSDNDGLPDWEENLRKTDPNNPDTDRDGTSDGEEVRAGRNPLKPTPNDREDEAIISTLAERRNTNKPMSSELFRPNAKQPETAAPTKTEAVPEKPAPIDEKKEALRAFGNALGRALAPVTDASFIAKENTLLQRTVGRAERDALTGLAPLARAYTEAASALSSITPPKEETGLLEDLKGGYTKLSAAIASLAEGETDTQTLSKRWMNYSDATLEIAKAFNRLIGLFREKHITFGSEDPGRIFGL